MPQPVTPYTNVRVFKANQPLKKLLLYFFSLLVPTIILQSYDGTHYDDIL